MTQLAYKFLDADGRAPFTGAEWPIGEWVESATASPCHEGVHGCRPADVSRWFAAAMWYVELDGEIVAATHKLVGRRGRLVAPVDGYDEAMRELRELSAWRCRDRAVPALATAGLGDLAERFGSVSSLAELMALGSECDDTFAGRAGALSADCAYFALEGVHAQAPFVGACSAGHVAAGPDGDQDGFDAGYGNERRFQSDWITERLSLT